jgi:hypothetical protein
MGSCLYLTNSTRPSSATQSRRWGRDEVYVIGIEGRVSPVEELPCFKKVNARQYITSQNTTRTHNVNVAHLMLEYTACTILSSKMNEFLLTATMSYACVKI